MASLSQRMFTYVSFHIKILLLDFLISFVYLSQLSELLFFYLKNDVTVNIWSWDLVEFFGNEVLEVLVSSFFWKNLSGKLAVTK